MLRIIKEIISRIQTLLTYSEKQQVVRRYFFLSAFDGALAAFGIISGAILVGEESPATIVAAGLGASLAMLISGVMGAYITEEAESRKRIKELEEAMLSHIEDSEVARASLRGAVITALINGLAAFGTSLLILSPYILSLFNLLLFDLALKITFTLTLILLFLLGIFLAKATRQNMLILGAKMMAFGLIAILLILLLNFLSP